MCLRVKGKVLFKKHIKKITLPVIIAAAGEGFIAADQYCIVTYDLYILPADFYIIVSGNQSEALALAPDYD